MTNEADTSPFKEAFKLTKILDAFDGEDRFDRGPVNVERLAREYSRQICPEQPIEVVEGRALVGCEGALVPGTTLPRKWGILYNSNQNKGRRNFTLAHEFGHYLLHRDLIDDVGLYCNAESIIQRNGKGIEKEADEFAANLLMPLHDFRKQIAPGSFVDYEALANVATRYGVSLTAATLRWLEYTEVRAILIVSNEGFVHWARSSEAAFKSGIYMKTKGAMNQLPSAALAITGDFTEQKNLSANREEPVWFSESCQELCVRSDLYDLELTVLQFEKATYRRYQRA